MKTTSATPNLVPLHGGDRGGLSLPPTQAAISKRSLALIPALLLAFIFCCLVHPAYGQFSLTNGLVAYYPFDGDANDASGSGNNGLIYGAIPAPDRSGRPNTCFKFTGTTNWIRLNVGPLLFASNFTIAVWIKIDDLQAHFPSLVAADGGYVRLQVLGSLPSYISEGYFRRVAFYQFQPGSGQQFGNLIATNLVNSNQWYHVAIVRSGLNFQMYLDGMPVEQKTESGSITLTGNYLQVGNDLASGTNVFFHGDIDDLRIYNRAFSSNEVQTLFLQQTPLTATISPSSVTVLPGNDVAFYANGLGVPPIIYQWFLNNVPITNSARIVGATSSLLTISNAQPQDTGAYSVRVANASGTNASGTSVLTVYDGDADGDGLPNSWENAFGLNPNNSSDATNNPLGDQLTYLHKYLYGLNPLTTDNDGDGLSDYDELFVHATNPLLPDADGDGIPDGWEVHHGLNPRFNDVADDLDGDGLSNLTEYNWSLSHTNQLIDPRTKYSTSLTLSDFAVVTGAGTNQFFYDRNDRLVGAEYDRGLALAYVYDRNDNLVRQVSMTHDANTNGLPDVWEFLNGITTNTSAFTDTDGDGWTDYQEWKGRSSPTNTASKPGLLDNPGLNIASLQLPFTPSNFVVGVGQLDGVGAEEIVIAGDGNPGTNANFLLVLTQTSSGWSTQRVHVGVFGITSIALGRPVNRPSVSIYAGLRGSTNGSGRIVEFSQSGGTWQSDLVMLSTNETAFVLGVRRGDDVLGSLATTDGADGALYSVIFSNGWTSRILDTNTSHRGLGSILTSGTTNPSSLRLRDIGGVEITSGASTNSPRILLPEPVATKRLNWRGGTSLNSGLVRASPINPLSVFYAFADDKNTNGVIDRGDDFVLAEFLPHGPHAATANARRQVIADFTVAQSYGLASLNFLDTNSAVFFTAEPDGQVFVWKDALGGSCHENQVAEDTLALWHLNGNSIDSSPSGINGADTAITYPPGSGVFGAGANFNGSTSWIDMGEAFSLRDNFSVAMWVKFNSIANDADLISKQLQSGSWHQFDLYFSAASQSIQFTVRSENNESPKATATSNPSLLPITTNQWYYVVATRDGTNINLYMNGVNHGSTPWTSRQWASPAKVQLGSSRAYNGVLYAVLDGTIDEVVVSSRAFSSEEILASLQPFPLQRQLFSGQYAGKAWHALAAVKTLEPDEGLIGLRVDPVSPNKCDVILWPPQSQLPQLATLPNTAPVTRVLPGTNLVGLLAPVRIRIWDGEGNLVLPLLQYQVQGTSNWFDAAIVQVDGLAYGMSTRVPALPTGSEHTLLWNVGAAFPSGTETNVLLRARAKDVTLLGDWSAAEIFQVTVNADSDQDGLPDAWESTHFGNLTQGASGDPDGDEFINWAEYIAGTDPNNPASLLEITLIEPVPGGMRLEWQGGILATQFLQMRLELGSGVWADIFTNPPTPQVGTYTNLINTNDVLFYRIRVER